MSDPVTVRLDLREQCRTLRADAELRALQNDYWVAGRLLGCASIIERLLGRDDDHAQKGDGGADGGHRPGDDRAVSGVQGTGLHASHGADGHDEPAQERAGEDQGDVDDVSAGAHVASVPANGAPVNPGPPA